MLIRGQHRTGLIDMTGIVLTVRENQENDTYMIIADNANSRIEVLMGIYSTKEKAVKALDRIQEAYLYDAANYQMPQDCEVEE